MGQAGDYAVQFTVRDPSGEADSATVFITVVPDIAFLEDHGRGIFAYQALQHRVFDEVRDRSLVNPMASLARISATAQGSL